MGKSIWLSGPTPVNKERLQISSGEGSRSRLKACCSWWFSYRGLGIVRTENRDKALLAFGKCFRFAEGTKDEVCAAPLAF